MKKIILATVSLVTFVTFSNAQFKDDTTTKENEIITIKEAEDMNDDDIVTLKGNILKKIDDEEYLFSDGKDEIEIEIDDEDWNNQIVTPSDTVKIKGKLDKDLLSSEIDVITVEKL